MGKKDKKGGNLGKALIRDRFGPTKIKRNAGDSMLHTSEINDGYDWGRLNLQSVTEESSFQEFLSTAELAGTEFQAEKLNITFVNPKSGIGLLTNTEKEEVLQNQEKHKAFLKIPRRPEWSSTTTAEELQTREKEKFLEWRRGLAVLQETQDLMLTPYEKNLEFWRQLWRVVERSDVVVQIVDARNPLLFRCEDLEQYVKEVNSEKLNMILINKADFLTEEQRQKWADYFTSINVQVAFFSAMLAAEKNDNSLPKLEETSENESEDNDRSNDEENDDRSSYTSNFASESEYESATENLGNNEEDLEEDNISNDDTEESNTSLKETINKQINENNCTVHNSSELLTRDKLIFLFKTIYKGKTYTKGITTIGLVGYPNVGKSSTINALLKDKKVSVSATPGKTKHFQTLFLDTDLLLCDCPGLVMPSFVCTKADMILNGILPIDQMRDHVPPVTLLATLIPKHVIEDLYGIMIPSPLEGEDLNRPPTAEEILNAYGYNRGFMTQNGQPDNPRSARYILKDFVNGRLLYAVAPPTYKQDEFHVFPPRRRKVLDSKHLPPRMIRASKGSKVTTDDLDKAFFQRNMSGVHIKGMPRKIQGGPQPSSSERSVSGSSQNLIFEEKPWKKINKHTNKKKREKTRRLYAYLDQH